MVKDVFDSSLPNFLSSSFVLKSFGWPNLASLGKQRPIGTLNAFTSEKFYVNVPML